MASFQKINGKWKAQVYKLGSRKTARFTTKAEAEAWAKRIETDIERGLVPIHSLKTMSDLFTEYSDKVSIHKRTYARESARLKHLAKTEVFGKPLGDYMVLNITSRELSEWRHIRLKSVKVGTVLREWTLLTHVFNIAAREWKLIPTNPLKDVTRPKKPAARDRLITQNEIDTMCFVGGYDPDRVPATATARVIAVMLFAIETGMRLKEITNLTWSQVDLVKSVAQVSEDSKTGKRQVPLSPRAVQLIEQVKALSTEKVFNLTERQVDSLFRKTRSKAGLSGFTFHDTKHLACTRLASKMNIMALA